MCYRLWTLWSNSIVLCAYANAQGECLTCPGDLNADEIVSTADLPLFVNCLITDTGCTCADFNNDTSQDSRDIPEFIRALLIGNSNLHVRAGLDCWKTTDCGPGQSYFSFGDHPIPAGFFTPDSLPFNGMVQLGPSIQGGFDTTIRRTENMVFCSYPSAASTPLVFEALDLAGCQPLAVSNIGAPDELWDVHVDLPQFRAVGGTLDQAIPPCNAGSLTSNRTIGPPNCPQVHRVRVAIWILHPRVGDLVITLTNASTGTTITLMNRVAFWPPGPIPPCGSCLPGGKENTNVNVIFDDLAFEAIQDETGSLNTGLSYRPAEPLSAFTGLQGCGSWQLGVSDCAGSLNGWLMSWSLFFDPPPPPLPGSMTVTREIGPPAAPVNAGVFASMLRVPARFTFTSQNNGAIRVLQTGIGGLAPLELSLSANNPAAWVGSLSIPGIEGEFCDPQTGYPRNFFPGVEYHFDPPPGEPEICCTPVNHVGPGHSHVTAPDCGSLDCD